MSTNKYATGSLRPRQIYMASLRGWWPAIKLAFFPFLIAIAFDFLLAFVSHHVKIATELYALRIASILIFYYFVMLAFYLIHSYWKGDESRWQSKVGVYSRRFFPALVVFVIVLLGAGLLIAVGEVMSRMLTPYAHLMGKVAGPILISIVGLLAVIWVIACFYWPFFMLRDGERFAYAMRRSFAIAGLAKTVMVYLPPVAFVLVFLLANPRLPWVNFPHTVWGTLGMEYLIKWILGAWVLTVTCLLMNESGYMLDQVESDIVAKKDKKAAKKAAKKAKKEAKKNANKE